MNHLIARADAARLPLPDRSVDLVFGSPPYRKARLYLEDGKDLGIARDTEEWIEWMLDVTMEAVRVCRGAVVWVAAGSTEDRNYHPICEGLMYRWWQIGGHAYRPCYWHRVGIPGSGGDQWFRSDVEHVMCFKRPGSLPWSDNVAMGRPCKYEPGGDPSHRTPSGKRVGSVVKMGGERQRKGEIQIWTQPEKANPGNLVKTNAGHGHMGSNDAHSNEAPFPESLAEHFIRSLCPEGGTVIDPFSGSGTTASVAARWGRKAIGFDLRQSQCRLSRRRYAGQATMFDAMTS